MPCYIVSHESKIDFTKEKKTATKYTFRIPDSYTWKFKDTQEKVARDFFSFLQSLSNSQRKEYQSKSGINKFLKLSEQKGKRESIKEEIIKNVSQKPANVQQNVKSVIQTKEDAENSSQKIMNVKSQEDMIQVTGGNTKWEIFPEKASPLAIANLQNELQKDKKTENSSQSIINTTIPVKMDIMDWEIYTDASFSHLTHTAGYAAKLISSKKNAPPLTISGVVVDEIKSSNEAEEYAVLKALEKLARIRPLGKVCFYCDFKRLVDQANEFISGNENLEDNVDNTMRNIFYYLKRLNKDKKYEFHWIPSHSGHEFNEICDSIARFEHELLRNSFNN